MQELGHGRAATVYLDRDAAGRPIVRKVFTGEAFSKLVLYVLTGAPNPYTWCESAIRAAVSRRRILAHLVAFWFGGKLRLPRAGGWQWRSDHLAFELSSELIDGRHAPLRGPREDHHLDPVGDLRREVMRPLQDHLIEAGFDGLVWQAGRGNPVAAGNFMLDGHEPFPGPEGWRWVWVDLESGVPALFALNPLATLRFYLPRSLRHRGWLFDDVDAPRLRAYVEARRGELDEAIGRPALLEIASEIDVLERQQKTWKSLPRHQRSIGYEQSQGRLTAEQAAHYGHRRLAWYARMAVLGTLRGARRVVAAARRSWAWLRGLDYGPMARAVWRFGTSQRYRTRAARRLVVTRLHDWVDRRFLDRAERRRLHGQLRRGDVSAYVTDFGIHLAMKPFIKALQWLGLPPMLALGWIDVATAGFILIAGGLIGRVLYTSGRMVQAVVQGQRRPWLAFGVSFLPAVGNAAYPAELVYCSTEESGDLARFILYDTLATTGRAVPIWGGRDSLVEHWFNRLGDVVIHWLAKPVTLSRHG